MSSEKVIDVREGDEWTMWPGDAGMYQYRNGTYRYIDDAHISKGWGSLKKDSVEVSIPGCAAKAILLSWGYTLTPVEGEKCQPKATSPVLTAEASGNARLVKETPPDFPTANGGKAELPKPAPQENKNDEKSCFRDVVPVVDAQARANAAHAHERLHEAWKRITALESRLAAVEPAPKPAAMVVKAPTVAKTPGLFTDAEMRMIHARDHAWRAALAEAGITIADEIQPSTKSRPAN